jgi:hypothetical protein
MASIATVFMGFAADAPRETRLGSFLRNLDDLPSAVLSAVRAGSMALRRLAAVRAGDGLRDDEGIVRAALVALLTRRSSLRYGHPILRESISA